MQSGGKVLGEGTYGCAINPPVICEDQTYNRNSVSKVMKKRSAIKEMKEFDIIKKIDPKKEFTIGIPKLCKNIKPLTEQPYETMNDLTKNCNISRDIRNMKGLHAIIMEYGGVSMEYIDADKLSVNMEKNKHKILLGLRRLFVGLVRMNQAKYAHNDIKPDNILYNPETHEFNIIDFGLMTKFNKIPRSAHPYVFYPYDYRLNVKAIYGNLYRAKNRKDVEKFIKRYGIPERHEVSKRYFKYLPDGFSKDIINILATYYQHEKENSNTFEEFVETLKRKFAEKLDVYSMGISLFRFLNKAYRNKQTPLSRKLSALFAKMINHDVNKRLSAEEALAQYDSIIRTDTPKRNKTRKYRQPQITRRSVIQDCKGKSEDKCNPPQCKYVKGAKRQYCRKSMNKQTQVKSSIMRDCKGKSEDKCNPPRCKYVKGVKRQYCRKTRKNK